MKGYFRARRTLLIVVVAVLFEAAVFFIDRPMVIHHGSGVSVFIPAAPLQILAVGALSLGLSGRSERFEAVGIRRLPLLRLLNAGILIAGGATTASLVALLHASAGVDPGTVGQFAPLRAFLGLMGIALVVAAFIDMRLGALCALPFVLLPAAFDLRPVVGGDALGFVLADANTADSWLAAILLAAAGLSLFTFAYRERPRRA